MVAPDPLPALRLKIPCADAREFLDRFAPRYAASGVFFPTERPRPVGTRLHLKIELRDGSVGASGEALVSGHVEGAARRGMTLRLTRPDPGSPRLDASLAAGRAPETSGPPPLPRPVGEPGADEADLGAPALRRWRGPVARPGRAFWAAVALAAGIAAALAGGLLRQHRAELRGAAFAEEIQRADARVREGRLAGVDDSALDHLAAARAIDPGGPGLRERLRLVADKLEELGERAARRGDAAEAAVDFRAALRAEPDRERARRRLAEMAAAPAAGK